MFYFDMFLDCLTHFSFDLTRSLYVPSVLTKNQEQPDGMELLGMLPKMSLLKCKLRKERFPVCFHKYVKHHQNNLKQTSSSTQV